MRRLTSSGNETVNSRFRRSTTATKDRLTELRVSYAPAGFAAQKGKLHQQGFNYALAEALRQVRARWRESPAFVICERSEAVWGAAKRPDILIDDHRMSKVVVECAYGGDNDKDAKERLEQGICSTAVAVSIPPEFAQTDVKEAERLLCGGALFDYALLQRDADGDLFRFPESGYTKGSVRGLASLIQAASTPKSRVEQVIDEVADLIGQAVEALSHGLPERDVTKIIAKMHQRTILSALRTGTTLWLDAMLVHSHLYTHGSVREPLGADMRPSNLIKVWQNILKLNWHSIFDPAIDVLENVSIRARAGTSHSLNRLAKAVEAIETARLGDHVSISGELFPKISDDRKEAAAFYTTTAAAELLTSLLIREDDGHDWQDQNLFRSLRVADLACGTGTLLRAAYRRVRTLHESVGGNSQTTAELHKNAMEYGIKAADVSPIAAHLANSGMALAGGGKSYGKTSIGWVSVGEPANAHLTTGSLEYLKNSSLVDLFADLGGSTGGRNADENPINVNDRSIDYVVMNPPYSRTRGGQSAFDIAGLSEKQRKGCQQRWGALIRNEPAVKTAGMAASFLSLARKKVKPRGKIGFVLPLTAAFADSWAVTRQMIAEEFEEVLAISRSGGEASEALSADTHMAEMLLVATHRKFPGPPKPICCVTLRRIPQRLGEAGEFGRSILHALDIMRGDSHPIIAGNEELGQASVFYPAGGEPWSHLGVLSADLAIAARRLVTEGVLPDITGGKDMPLKLPMTTIDSLFDVGPTHDLIGHLHTAKAKRGAFVLHPISRPAEARHGIRSLWKADARTQNRLAVDPTHKLTRWGAEDSVNKMLSQRGSLHYARNLRWTSQALLAASTQTDVLGGRAWTTLMHADARALKAFALWVNSSLGLITHWTRASRTQKGRGTMQVKAIADMPCPDVAALDSQALSAAANKFDALCTKELKPACQAHADPVRAEIDNFAVEMLGLPKTQARQCVNALRELWCIEPTVHGDNRKALELLFKKGLV